MWRHHSHYTVETQNTPSVPTNFLTLMGCILLSPASGFLKFLPQWTLKPWIYGVLYPCRSKQWLCGIQEQGALLTRPPCYQKVTLCALPFKSLSLMLPSGGISYRLPQAPIFNGICCISQNNWLKHLIPGDSLKCCEHRITPLSLPTLCASLFWPLVPHLGIFNLDMSSPNRNKSLLRLVSFVPLEMKITRQVLAWWITAVMPSFEKLRQEDCSTRRL